MCRAVWEVRVRFAVVTPGHLVIGAAQVIGLRDQVDDEIQVPYVHVTSQRMMRDAGGKKRKVMANHAVRVSPLAVD